jgi:hypothetical protein
MKKPGSPGFFRLHRSMILMCVNYRPPSHQQLVDVFDVRVAPDASWPAEAWKDYAAPIILLGADGSRMELTGGW